LRKGAEEEAEEAADDVAVVIEESGRITNPISWLVAPFSSSASRSLSTIVVADRAGEETIGGEGASDLDGPGVRSCLSLNDGLPCA
jgi:hypothetical protein